MPDYSILALAAYVFAMSCFCILMRPNQSAAVILLAAGHYCPCLMAGEQGFEPWNAGIKIQCLNQLGDSPTQSAVCRRHLCLTGLLVAVDVRT